MVGGSEIKINEHGIFITTPALFRVKAEIKEFLGGEQVPMPPPPFLPKPYTVRFHFTDDYDVPYAHTPYIAHNKATNETIRGVTDHKGKTQVFYADQAEDIEIHLEV